MRTGWVCLSLHMLLLSMCVVTETVTAPESNWWGLIDTPPTNEIHYHYGWDTAGITFLENDTGWQTETDLGYTVTVNLGYIVSYQVQIVPCDLATTGEDTASLWNLFKPPKAHAAHDETFNPAAIYTGYVESLHDPQTLFAGSREPADSRFCQSHYLIARGEHETEHYPEDIEMMDRSLYVAGSWKAPGSDEEIPFVIDSASAWGALSYLYPADAYGTEGAQIEIDVTDQGTLVLIDRKLGRIFDGIDFADPELTESQQATRVLKGIFSGTEIRVIQASGD